MGETVFITISLILFTSLLMGLMIVNNQGQTSPFADWFWVENSDLTEAEWMAHHKGPHAIKSFKGISYELTLIPETGLDGFYAGQGDLRWAWVEIVTND